MSSGQRCIGWIGWALAAAALSSALGLVGGCTGKPGARPLNNQTAVRGDDGAPDGPRITLVDSTVLQESDSAFLGRVPYTYAVDSAGSIYVTDQTTDRLMIFGPDGSLRRIVGRHGGGPGEFERIGPLTIAHDSVLLQGARGNTLTLLNAKTLAEINRLHHSGYVSSWSATKRRLVLGQYDPAEKYSVIAISWDSVLGASNGARVRPMFAALPAVYATYPGLDLFNQVLVANRGDTILVGFGATDFLVRIPLLGGRADTIQVPRLRRRAISSSVFAKFRKPSLSFYDGITSLPNLLGVWPTSDGHVVLWFQEGATEDARRGNAEIIGYAYLSVLTPDLRQACVDGRVEAPGTGRTRLAFAQNTLYSLDQVMTSAGSQVSNVRTVVRRYHLDLDKCRWLPTGDHPAY